LISQGQTDDAMLASVSWFSLAGKQGRFQTSPLPRSKPVRGLGVSAHAQSWDTQWNAAVQAPGRSTEPDTGERLARHQEVSSYLTLLFEKAVPSDRSDRGADEGYPAKGVSTREIRSLVRQLGCGCQLPPQHS